MAEKKNLRDYLVGNTTRDESTQSAPKKRLIDYLTESSTSTSSKSTGTLKDYMGYDPATIVGNNVTNRVNSWLQNYNSLTSDYQKRYSGRKGTYEDAYVSDSADWYDKVSQQVDSYEAERQEILSYLNKYGGHLDANWVEKVRNTLAKGRDTQLKIRDSAKGDNEYWSLFTPNEEQTAAGYTADKLYNEWQAEQKKLVYDVEAGAADVEKMMEDYDSWFNLQVQTSAGRDYFNAEELAQMDAQLKAYEEKFGTLDGLKRAIHEKEVYNSQAQQEQDLAAWNRYNNEADFDEYAKIGETLDYTEFGDTEAHGSKGARKRRYTTIDNYRAASIALYEHNGGEVDSEDAAKYSDQINIYRTMKDDEFQRLAYFIAKDKENGTNMAKQYVDTLDDVLKQRRAFQIKTGIDNIDIPVIEDFAKLGYGFTAGYINAYAGISQYVTGEKLPTDVSQYANQYISESLDGIGYYAHQAATTVGNMAPSILVSSALGPAAGAVTMGVSSAGNAYAQALDWGYDKTQSRIYGTLVGAAEGTLQYLIGGIGSLGGVSGKVASSTAKLAGKVAAIDSSLLRVAAKLGLKGLNLGLNISSEILEEELQNYLEPAFRTIIFSEEYDAPTMDELIETAIVTALSTGVLEGGNTSSEVNKEVALNRDAVNKYGVKAEKPIQVGLGLDANSEANKLAQEYQKKVEGGKKLTGYEIRQLLAANKDQITADDMQKIQKAARDRLKELGQTENVKELAELATKYATGQELTRDEKRFLTSNEFGAQVAKDLSESGEYTADWTEDIGTGLVNYKEYNRKKIKELIRSKIEQMAKLSALDKRVDEKDSFAVSKTGKATIRETGVEIDLSKPEIVDFVKEKKSGKITDMILNVDGKNVKASEIDFADDNQSYLFSAVKHIENITPGDAQVIIRDYNPSYGLSVSEYLNGVDEAFTYGYNNYSEADMQAGVFTIDLTEQQAKSAYLLGKAAKSSSNAAKTESIKRMRTAVEAEAQKAAAEGKEAPKAKGMTITYNAGSGKVVDFKDAGLKKLSKEQKAAPALAEAMHEMGLGTNFELYASYLSEKMFDEEGNRVRVRINENGVEEAAPAGIYRKSDGTVCIDLNAYNGRELTLDSMAHELTHFIQQWSDTKYQVLAEFLVETYDKKTDLTMHERVIREQARLESIRKEKVSYNEAFDEVVANAMSKMLADGKVMDVLAELQMKDAKLAKKLWEGLKKLLNKFFRVYKNKPALFNDAADLMELKEEFAQMKRMWAEAFAEASENFQTYLTASESQALTEAGFGFDENTKSVYSLQFSNAVNEEIQVGKKAFNAEAIAQLVSKVTGRSIKDARKWVQSEMTIANIVMQNPEFLDFEADNRYDAIKKNSDYPQGTVDLSNLCPKREEFTAMFDMLQKKYPNKLFTAQDVADMRKILADNDITVACGACFVEDRRQLIGEIADTFIGMWKEAVESGKPLQKTNAAGQKSDLLVTKALAKQYGLTAGTKIMATDTYIPNQYDLTTYEGFKKLEKNHPTIAMSFNRYNNSRGQQSARLIEGRAEYDRQILGWSDAKVRSVNNNGGLRIFSFSDFEVVHLLDLVQVIIDCAAKGVKIQGYTKIPAFAKLVSNTGVKLNRSHIPKGDYGYHMENGKVVLDQDTTEGIDTNDKNFMDESDNPDVCDVIIGINPIQIGAAMLDPFFDYIIPFHSNKAKAILEKLGTGKWVNYKESQHEKDIATGTASKRNVNIYTEVINKYHPTNKVEFVEAFLKECKRQGKIPRYAEFLNVDANGDYAYCEGYHKLLVDFKMFDNDGNILPQGNITPNLDDAFMKELLNAEIDKKQNYEFPQEVYDAIDKKFGEQYSSQETDADKKITLAMTDSERTEILQTKAITAEAYDGQADALINQEKTSLESDQLGLVESALLRIADQFEVFTGYDIKDVGVRIEFSKSNLSESVSKKITPKAIAKLLPVLKTAVENAVGIESHSNRYFFDTDIVRFDNLVGGYVDGENFVPVRFGLKHRRNGEAILYVIIDQQKVPLNKIKAEVVEIAGTQSVQPEVSRSAFKVNISDLVQFVNSGDLLRYVPDNMLTESQKQIKWDAIADTIVKTNKKNDAKYAKYIRDGKIRAASQMVKAAAKDAGYTTRGYHGSRTPGFTVADKYSWLWFARDESVANGYGTHDAVDSNKKPHNEKGVYTMLYNLGNNLEVYADGSSWGDLPVTEDEYPGVYVDEYTGEITTNAMAEWAERNGYDSITFVNVDDGGLTTVDVVFNPNRDAKSADPITYDDDGNVIPISQRFDKGNDDLRYSSQETDADNAPIFYSKMGKVIEGIKQDKFGASSVISMLRDPKRGVKAEEIRWSGIQAFLDGKKSVTKQELLDFIKGSMLQIEDETRSVNKTRDEFVQAWRSFVDQDLDDSEILAGLDSIDEMEAYLESLVEDEDLDRYYADYILGLAKKVSSSKDLPAKWDQYKLDGGSNYRELLFKLPNSNYSNTAMKGHWGEGAKGVLAHARMQDFEVDGKKMLFIEEIQSDWHNAGRESGYRKEGQRTEQEIEIESSKAYRNFYTSPVVRLLDGRLQAKGYYNGPTVLAMLYEGDVSTYDFLERIGVEVGPDEKQFIDQAAAEEAKRKEELKTAAKTGSVPDAPFKKNYHEYALKRLLRMAAEEGYDSIGWTTAEIQDERWANTMPHKEGTGKSGFLKAYTIEYDQNIKSFLEKFGKQWGAEVGKTRIDEGNRYTWDEDLFADDELSDDWLLDDAEQPFDGGEFAFKDGFTYSGTEVWTMPITDAMRKSVLTEGQELYSSQQTDRDYMDALDKGNIVAAQKLVDQAAEKAGYTVKAYHGTGEDFNIFSEGKIGGRNVWGKGFYFGASKGLANDYATWRESKGGKYRIVSASLKMENPYINRESSLGSAQEILDKWFPNMWKDTRELGLGYIQGKLKNDPHDLLQFIADKNKIEIRDVLAYYGYDSIKSFDELVVFSPTQIKSNEPVVWDDNGKIIPLSERFNKDNDDIRYSTQETDLDTNRYLLANAFEGITKDSKEYELIQEYKGRIKILNEYEEKLRGLNAEIRKILFDPDTERDAKKLKQLQAEAKEVEGNINRNDKKLLSLEASEPLRKVIERERKKESKKTKDHVKQLLKNKKDRAEQTELRHKIRNFKKKLEAKLLRPTDRQYVPVNLIKAMVDVCDLIDTDTDLYKADGSINKAQVKRDETREKLAQLKDEYEKLQDHTDPMYASEFDDMVYTYLKELREKFSEKSLKEMSLDELAEMYEILRGIDETLADARKLIGWGDAESVYEAGDSIVAEQNTITQKRKNGKRNAVQKGLDKIDNLSLSPVRNVERMSGYNQDSALLKLFKKFEQGIRKKNKFVMNAYKSFERLTSGKEYDDAVYKEVGGKKYTDVNGRKFGLSKMQMMQAILSYERETANKMNHIEGSGFSFADLDMLRKGKLKDAISEEYSHRVPAAITMVAEFQEALKDDKWCQDYMAAARKFFNETAKDAINETSIALKHRIIAKDKSYIPFEVDKNFVVREISAENDIQQTINSYGMLKDTKKGAAQPLIITGLNNILDRHIDQVGNVYGLAIEVRNFNKVWNVRSKDDVGNDPTVKTAVQRNWGVEGVKHIEQAVQDIQGPRVRERSALYDKVKSNYIGATFLLNLSVVTKQIGSLFSATSMLRWRDPARMISNLIYTMANHKKISAEVDKYTASAWMRRQGMSDAELYTLMTQAKKPGILRLVDKAPAIINPAKWITAMDHAVALSLWRYAKQDTAKRTGFKGEELLKATAEFYDEVVENTQSMTDVLHRPEIQKSDNILAESFAMFKTDLYQMAGQLQATTGRYLANKSKENGIALGRTVYSIAMGAIWGQLMTTVFALLRYKVDRYRDDDDEEDEELTAESWLKRQGFGIAGDLMGYIFPIFGSEVVGAFERIMYGESDDVVDNIVLTAINDLFDIMIIVGTSIKDGELPDAAKMKKYTVKALQVFSGLPANNVLRTVEAIQLHAEDIVNGEFLSFNAGIDSKYDKLYNAIISGDKTKHVRLKSTYVDKEGNFDQSKYDTAVRTALKENDPRIREAAQARVDGNIAECQRIYHEIKKDGKFNPSEIMDAIYSMESDIRNDLAPEKVKSQYDTGKFIDAVTMDEIETALAMRDDIIDTHKANGKTQEDAEKAFKEDLTSSIKEAFLVRELDEAEAEKMLMEYAGKDEEEAASKVSYWSFIEAHQEYKNVFTESHVEKYREFAEPAGISVDVYAEFINGKKGIKPIKDEWGDVEVPEWDQIVEVIHALPLTWQQKDALYMAADLAESRIWEVPW